MRIQHTMKLRLGVFLTALFFLLAAIYVLDFNRIDTVAKIEPKGLHTGEDYMLSSLNVTTISQDLQKRIWIGTSAGLNVFDGQDYVQFSHDKADTTALPDDYINIIHRDRSGHMWIGTQNGLARYEGGYRFRRFALPNGDDNVTVIADASDAIDPTAIVAGNGKHSYKVNAAGVIAPAATVPVRKEIAGNEILSDSVVLQKPRELVSAVFRDAGGNLWVGFHNAGYRVVSENLINYMRANNNSLVRLTRGKDVTSMELTGRYVLAGTTLRLCCFDSKSGKSKDILYSELFDRLPSPTAETEQIDRREINDLVAAGDDKVWIINDNQVLSCKIHDGSITVTGRTDIALAKERRLGTGVRVGDHVYVSSSDHNIIRCGLTDDAPEAIPVKNEWYDEETQMTLLRSGEIMLFMRDMKLALFNPTTGKLTPFDAKLPMDDVTNIDPAFILQDSYGTVWLGTKRSGLYSLSLSTRKVERMKFLSDVHIQGMVEDKERRLWITTLKDATCYQPSTGAVLLNSLVSSSQNNWHRQFFDLSICLSPEGDVLFGTSDGCVFLPSTSGKWHSSAADLRVTSIDIRNTDGENLTINDDIGDGSHYTLAHGEKSLTFRFFYPNYSRRSSLMYQYMMEGYDPTWREPTYKHSAYFANLMPGDYTFRLRLISSPNLPPVAERTVRITVKPAPWFSAAAWLFYIICIGAAIYYANMLYLTIRTNRLRLAQEQHEREREKRTNEMNMSFFANISHEFRNPITLIAGPLLQLKTDLSLPDSARQSLNRVCMSVNRMLRLIDQMLDFNQLETDALRLKVTDADAVRELKALVETFGEPAGIRGIRVETRIEGDTIPMKLDADKFEKIVSNLFTNALKYTPDGGVIRISARMTDQEGASDSGQYGSGQHAEGRSLCVEVYNSGSHIEEDKLQDVFKRYYQLAATGGNHHYGWGTGIGLYYVKRLVTLHHGEIHVENTADGVLFSFSLPAAADEYRETEIAKSQERVMQIPVDSPQEQIARGGETSKEGKSAKPRGSALRRTRLLIVDDDVDVAQYIRSIFESDYDVVNRYSAEDALRDMQQIAPDLVMSDIVMGEMSGFDFCRKLKEDLTFSHIPVILVTAKSDINERIAGYRLGAVAYVTKPFDPEYLRAVAEAQLEGVSKLRKRLGEQTGTDSLADSLSEQDRRFMDELYALMEKRAAEMELNVATVSRDMLVSQSKFTYKLKELTGETPGSFFRRYKLNKAAKLLLTGDHNVSEVATLCGFATAAHFSVAFKKQFGVSPGEYKG